MGMEPERSDDRQSRKPLDWQEWLQHLEPLRARCRERMIAQGLDPDTMTEDEISDYVNNAIKEVRERRRIQE